MSKSSAASSLEHTNAQLFERIKDGDAERVKQLVDADNVNVTDDQGRHCTPLHIAAGFGHGSVVDYLLSLGADVGSADDYGVQPLHNAAAFGHTNVCLTLLKAGADVNAVDKWSFTALHEAASRAKVDVCIVLLQFGASPTVCNSDGRSPVDVAVEPTVAAVFTGQYRKQQLLDAARAGNDALLAELLTPLNVNVPATDGRHSTALHLAAGYNRVRCVELLLGQGADVHAKDKGALVPLHNACSYGHLQVTEMLLKHGADVNAKDQWLFTPLHEAASKNRAEVCSVLLAHDADIHLRNANDKNALELAAGVALRQQLLREYNGYQLLQACAYGNVERARQYVSADTVNFRHYYTANSALHVVCATVTRSAVQLAELLCAAGANVNERNAQMQTPAHLATLNDQVDLLRLLHQYNADLAQPDGLGDTVLHLAVCQSPTTVSALLQLGVDSSVQNLRGVTAVQLCEQLQGAFATAELFAATQPGSCQSLTPSRQSSKSVASPVPSPSSTEAESGTGGSTEADKQMFHTLHTRLLEAARCGSVRDIHDIVSSVAAVLPGTRPQSLVNARDPTGRQSTALHFAAGYNRLAALHALLDVEADIHATDKGGLVPLHNACSYGHYEVAQLLVSRGADVNATDLWKFTPLHEAASKGKFDICKLLLDNGADAARRNRDGQRAIDLVAEADDDVADLLRGNVALLDAAKHGNIDKVKKLLTADNVNCKDVQGRHSTPLHLAAGYNNLEVAAYLLENGADVNCQDKGGLIPLHNAASYGHVEMAALLLSHGADLAITDRWGFTALHEAAHKGRTQTCLLLLAHGALPHTANHQALTPYDIAATDDVKCLLLEAMPTSLSEHELCEDTAAGLKLDATPPSSETDDEVLAAAGERRLHEQLQCPVELAALTQPRRTTHSHHNVLAGLKRPRDLLHQQLDKPIAEMSIVWFLKSIGLESVIDLMIKEQITMDVLVEMGHDELKQIGLDAYGTRHKLVRNIEKLTIGQPVGSTMPGFPASSPPGYSGTVLVPLNQSHPEFLAVDDEVRATIVEHRDGGASGGLHIGFVVEKVHKIFNRRLWERYIRRREDVAEENSGQHNEKLLFHGSPFVCTIVQRGFDERHAYLGGMFGAGIYFAEHCSKSNQYVYGIGGGAGCAQHRDKSCYMCKRQLILCRTTLGSQFQQLAAAKLAHAPPGHHSVVGRPAAGGLNYPEYVIYRGEQAYPEYLITYTLRPPPAQAAVGSSQTLAQ